MGWLPSIQAIAHLTVRWLPIAILALLALICVGWLPLFLAFFTEGWLPFDFAIFLAHYTVGWLAHIDNSGGNLQCPLLDIRVYYSDTPTFSG